MSAIDCIKSLHTAMIDTERAYAKAEDETDDPKLKSLFGEMVTFREHCHQELHNVLLKMGQKPDENGSFMTVVHRTVIGVRAAVIGIGRGALPSFISGEQNLIEEYDQALLQADRYKETADLLSRQRARLAEKIGEMRSVENTGANH